VLTEGIATPPVSNNVRTVISEVIKAIANYSERERDQVQVTAREASNRVGEHYGTLQARANSARDALNDSFSGA